MYATDKEIKEQLEFVKTLVKRLDEKQGVTTFRTDIKRIRRELNELSKMTLWEYRR